MVEFLAPKVHGAKGWEVDMCFIPLQQTNFMASVETMTKLVLENMLQQGYAAPGSMETKERGRYTWQGTNQKGMGWSQEGIDHYNELFKETVLNRKESWAIDFDGCSRVTEGMTLLECIVRGDLTVKDKEKTQVRCSGW
jgi:hypothetical protein